VKQVMAANSGEKVFTSWKEIASFFGKGVRTVQRWEQKFGLPISRPTAAKNVVLTTENELREWIRRSSSKLIDEDGSNGSGSNENSIAELAERLKRLENETARLAHLVASFSDRMAELDEKVSSESKLATPHIVPPTKRSTPKPTSSAGK
jgi:phage terminase Nu1 subunit (DNA packaging protein)